MRSLGVLALLLVSGSDYTRSGYPYGGDDLYRALCSKDGSPVGCQEAYEYRADMVELCQEADEACDQ
jgi:hypothetical protein